MKAATVNLARSRLIEASVSAVWEWMCDADQLRLFRVNPFHAHAECDDCELQVGSEIRVDHRLVIKREMRIARISTLRRYEIAWGELKEAGEDWFPHSQRFQLTPEGEERCTLENTLGGIFHLPGARWWLTSWYRFVLPRVLDLENRRIARAVEGEVHCGPVLERSRRF